MTTTPWYKQFWPWFMLLPLASAVVMGITFVIVAFVYEDSLVSDHYYREGLAINSSLDRERIASALNLQADLSINHASDEVHVALRGDATTWPWQLKLELLHPIDKNQDRALLLVAAPMATSTAAEHYSGQWDMPITAGQWYVQLSDVEQGDWLIKMRCFIDEMVFNC